MTPRATDDLSLTKGEVLSGLRCHKKLWLEFHEENAPELQLDDETKVRFAEGRLVGELARKAVGAGVNLAPEGRVSQQVVLERTAEAMGRGEPLLFEAGFVAGGGSVRADILQRDGDAWRMIEVKSSKWPEKDRDREKKFGVHLPDIAVQTWVARESRLDVSSAHLMYLNPECRHPDLSNLFTTVEVTSRVLPIVDQMPDAVRALHAVVRGPMPGTPVGAHCADPDECPFHARCHPQPVPHSVDELYYARRKDKDALAAAGKGMIRDLDESDAPNAPARRQVRAVKAGNRLVEPGLRPALNALKSPIVHLDFETVQLAVPRWPGCGPQEMVAVQFSVHREREDGTVDHLEFLAERGDDPRPAIIDALIEACRGAGTVLVYFEAFEKKRIEDLASWFPGRAAELMDIHARIVDLLPIVRDNVYDLEFHGSFSLKKVLPALVHDLSYDNLEIREGGAAAAAIYRLLFEDGLSGETARALRANLLAYCKRDTEAMVRLLAVLRSLAT